MDHKDTSELERMLFDEGAEPKALPLSLLKHITNGFSDDKKIGYGGFSVVYKGMLDSGTVAVKKLLRTLDIDEKNFSKEVQCLMNAKHKNIVRFLGYCSDTQGEMVDYEGELVLADVRERLLCFEYLSQGSLDKQITDASCGLDWKRRYQIINGICEGLYFLHQKSILHLDLKPANILLDDNMVPKIADFGISRFFDEKKSGVTTSSMIGTVGYLAPEFYGGRKMTFKLDIYSLGIIIIDIITGEKGCPNIDTVLERWRNRLEKTMVDTQLVQVRVCTEIAIQCTQFDPEKRPDTRDIIDNLGAIKSVDESATETAASSSSGVQAAVPLGAGPSIGLGNTMDNEVKKSIEDLYNITHHNRRFSSMPEYSSNVQQVTDIRETASDVEEALIIGRTEEKWKTMNTLSGSITPEFTVLPIYGIGGIGKTTLAQLIFNDSQFACYSRVWVYVSQNLDLNRIGNSIISQLSKVNHVSEKQMIHNHLRKLLAGKKILIVLDDVWEKNPDTIKSLKAMLRLGADSMVTVILTTRDEAIAREVCHTADPYKLESLTNKMCWTIIKQKSAFQNRVDKNQLKHVGKVIAAKCAGVALAAQSLGYMLNGKTSDEWESVRDNYIWNISPSEDPSSRDHDVLASLMLSYSYMPAWLKLCFSYCAVFQKGHNIVKCDLFHQWIALGFTEPSRIFDSMQLCEKYVTQLLGMSFLQYSRTSTSEERQDKDVTLFTMHDLVHDLATAILADRVSDKGYAGGNKCRYAILTDCRKPLQEFVSSPENLKALHFLDCGKIILRGDTFSLAMCLHILDLSECFIEKLPDCVGQLKQLRFLRAPRVHDVMIPGCITELPELNYLNLRNSYISKLPESMGDMKGLMHLDLSGCRGIHELPVSFAELKQLVHLDLSNCRKSILEYLGGFTKLQYLNLSRHGSHYPKAKDPFTFFLKNRGPLKKHYPYFQEVFGNFIKLRYLNLSGCMKFMAQSEDQINSLFGSISIFSNLEHLDLSNNWMLSSIPESIGNLWKLHTLNLSGCCSLQKLPDSMVYMVSLKFLNLKDCRMADEFSMNSQLNVVSLPHFVVHAFTDKSSSNIILLQPTNPVELWIDRLENVKSAEEAQSIKLREKQKIEELTFHWSVDAERLVEDKDVLEKLVPPSSLKELSINGYRSVNIPNWLMGISHHLPNLWKIELCDFPNCNNLPLQLGQLPELTELSLCRMKGLEEWSLAYASGQKGVNELMFPKLSILTIKECAKLKLRIRPCLPRAWILHIADSDNVLSSWGESSSHSTGSSFTSVEVEDSKLPLHQWRLLRHTPALRHLTISCCSDMTTSPEIIQHLQSLTSLDMLSLRRCKGMTSVPQWLGELTSLKTLQIISCNEIMSLPDIIQQMNVHLEIRNCPTLEEWLKSREKGMKLDHIREVYPRSPTSVVRVDKNRRKPMNTEEAIELTNVKKVGDSSEASIHDTPIDENMLINLIDEVEVPPDPLYIAVMNMAGFTEEALLVASSHLMDNDALRSAFMRMHEEHRVLWLRNFLAKHN